MKGHQYSSGRIFVGLYVLELELELLLSDLFNKGTAAGLLYTYLVISHLVCFILVIQLLLPEPINN